MSNNHLKLLFVASLASLSQQAGASELALPTLVVTPGRYAEPLRDVQATTLLIDRQTIERSQARDVGQLLRQHAGIEIGRTGGPGQQTSVFMRGTDSNQTLILLDGVPINPGTIGNAAIQNIDPRYVQRIEVVKGPGSTLYGSAAIGGVINIITRRDAGPHGGRVTSLLSTGSDKTNEVALGASYQSETLRFGLDATHLSTNGFPTRKDSNLDQGHENTGLSLSAGAELGPVELELRHWQAKGDTEYLGFFLNPLDQGFTNRVTSLTADARLSPDWDTTLRFSQMLDDLQQRQSDDFARTRRNTLDWQNHLRLDRHQQLTGGLTTTHEATRSLSFGSGFDETIDSLELFAQDDIVIGDHRLTLALRHTHHELFNGAWTWNLAWGHQLTPATRLVASAGSAFRAPDSSDLFGFGGNRELNPERSRSVELNLRQQLSASQRLSVSLFQTRIRDLITFVDPDGFLGPQPGKNVNLEEARINGLEVNYRFTQGPWELGIETLLQDPKNLDSGRTLARRAKRKLSLDLGYTASRWDARLEFLAASKRNDSDFSDQVMGGYGLTNISGRYHLDRNLSLEGRIENLFDKEYELASGFNTQDQAFFLGVSYRP